MIPWLFLRAFRCLIAVNKTHALHWGSSKACHHTHNDFPAFGLVYWLQSKTLFHLCSSIRPREHEQIHTEVYFSPLTVWPCSHEWHSLKKSNSIVNFISHQRLSDANSSQFINCRFGVMTHKFLSINSTSSAAFIYHSTSYPIHAFSKFKIVKLKKK